MQEPTNQKISLLLDDQLDSREAIAMLERIADDPALQAQLWRYQTASAAIKHGAFAPPAADFSRKVSQRLAQEPFIVSRPQPRPAASVNWQKAGLALVASGLLAAMWLNSQNNNPRQATPTLVYNLSSQGSLPAGVNPRLNEYLLAHDSFVFNRPPQPAASYGRTVHYRQE